jgi:hypothetical protein
MLNPGERDDWNEDQRQAWLTEQLPPVSKDLVELVRGVADHDYRIRDALNVRLSGTATFAGALLAVAVTQGEAAGKASIPSGAEILFSIAFVGTIVLLGIAIAVALSALRPTRVTLASQDVLRYYGRKASPDAELRTDTFRLQIVNTYELRAGNARRASGLTIAQRLTAVALGLAAIGALTLFLTA